MKTEEDFLEWLSGAKIHICHFSCGNNQGFICVSAYSDRAGLEMALLYIRSRREKAAAEAYEWICSQDSIWHEIHKDPGRAMVRLTAKMREYYFDVLNKDA